MFKKLKKFFNRPKPNWQVIYEGTCKAYLASLFGSTPQKVECKFFVEIENTKNLFRAYITEGTVRQPLDIKVLARELPEIQPILTANGIPF